MNLRQKYKYFEIRGYKNDQTRLMPLKGRFLSIQQAQQKIKTLDKGFEYYILPRFNWVKEEDVVSGMVLYITHPFYLVEDVVVTGEPFELGTWGEESLWFYTDRPNNIRSCEDAGMYEHNYNDRRTFLNLEEALDYIDVMRELPDVIIRQKDHEERTKFLRG